MTDGLAYDRITFTQFTIHFSHISHMNWYLVWVETLFLFQYPSTMVPESNNSFRYKIYRWSWISCIYGIVPIPIHQSIVYCLELDNNSVLNYQQCWTSGLRAVVCVPTYSPGGCLWFPRIMGRYIIFARSDFCSSPIEAVLSRNCLLFATIWEEETKIEFNFPPRGTHHTSYIIHWSLLTTIGS